MTSMTAHERQTLTKLCARISDEKNPDVFTELVTERNRIFTNRPLSVRPIGNLP